MIIGDRGRTYRLIRSYIVTRSPVKHSNIYNHDAWMSHGTKHQIMSKTMDRGAHPALSSMIDATQPPQLPPRLRMQIKIVHFGGGRG